MALQPASGAKDLNPQQVEENTYLSRRLSKIYKLWGYEEVSPPTVERLVTLNAGGAIELEDIVKIVADEPLGLRPEMTASIARGASTRLNQVTQPLRLYATGNVFEKRESAEGGVCIEEHLQCGVELLGIKGISAEIELLTLLLEAMDNLNLSNSNKPILLIGHTSIIDLIMEEVGKDEREAVRNYLIDFDRHSLENFKFNSRSIQERILNLLDYRGYPTEVIRKLEDQYSNNNVLNNIKRLFSMVEPMASDHGIRLQLDPTFMPHFELYNGIVFQLICQGNSSPVVIARGGRYDGVLEHCGVNANKAAGLGFSFAIDKIRELKNNDRKITDSQTKVLVTYSKNKTLEEAFTRLNYWHQKGVVAQIELKPFHNKDEAYLSCNSNNSFQIDWLS